MATTRIRQFIAFMLMVGTVLGGLVTPASAQAQTYTSQLTGVDISYGPPYRTQPEGTVVEGQMEFLILTGEADLAGIGFMPAGLDLNAMRDSFLGGLFGEMSATHQIDRGDYEGVSYSLDMLQLDGYEMAVFTLFLSERPHGYAEFQVYLAPPSLFTPLLQNAQSTISIGGTPFLQGIDAEVMGQMVTANIGITGGATTTNVSEVQNETPDPGVDATVAPTIVPTTAPTSEGTTGNEELRAYLTHILTHRSEFHGSVERVNTALSGLSNDSTQEEAAAAFSAIDAEAQLWQQYSQTAQQVTPPAGYEELHAIYVDWAAEVTTLGTMWTDLQNGTVTTEAFFNQFNVALGKDADLGDALVDAAATLDEEGSETPAPTAEQSAPTETAVQNSGDPNVYLAEVLRHRADLHGSVDRFNTALQGLSTDSTQEEVDAAFAIVRTEAVSWQGYTERASLLVPSAGQEELHTLYTEWAAEVTTLGNLWTQVESGTATSEQFFDQLDVVIAKDTELGDALVDAISADEGDEAPATDVAESEQPTPASTEPQSDSDKDAAPVRRKRTPVAADPTPASTEPQADTDEDDDAAPVRTRRTSTATETTPEPTQEQSRNSKSLTKTATTEPESENTSETTAKNLRQDSQVQGKKSSTTEDAAAGSWESPTTDATVVWPEGFAQLPSPPDGEDQLFLQHEDGGMLALSVTAGIGEPAELIAQLEESTRGTTGAQEVFGESAEVVWTEEQADSASALVRVGSDSGADEWLYVQVTCVDDSCGEHVYVMIRGDAESLVPAVTAANEGVRVNDVVVTDAADPADIQISIDEAGN